MVSNGGTFSMMRCIGAGVKNLNIISSKSRIKTTAKLFRMRSILEVEEERYLTFLIRPS